MGTRLQLDQELRKIVPNVYFQPPESLKMRYPCILYERSTGVSQHADNLVYRHTTEYQLTYITKDPDDAVVDILLHSFEMIRHDRFFVVDNLNHDVYTLFY